MGYRVKLFIGVLCHVALAFSQIVQGEELPVPNAAVLLTITGAIAHPNVGDEVQLDLAGLESLPAVEYKTATPWHEHPQQFTGVRVSTLLEAIGTDSTAFVAIGLDDYKFTVSDLDFNHYPVIIAYRHNGKSISIRDLGPLRIIMPISDYPELKTSINDSRSVWQLVALELL